MGACARCGGQVRERFRFCPWCAAPLRRKLVEFFPAGIPRDRGKALRVSRYLDEGHVRFSVWDESGEARAAVSLDEEQAGRLSRFLAAGPRVSALERLRESVRR